MAGCFARRGKSGALHRSQSLALPQIPQPSGKIFVSMKICGGGIAKVGATQPRESQPYSRVFNVRISPSNPLRGPIGDPPTRRVIADKRKDLLPDLRTRRLT